MTKKQVRIDEQDKVIIAVVEKEKVIRANVLANHEMIEKNNVKSLWYRLDKLVDNGYIMRWRKGPKDTSYVLYYKIGSEDSLQDKIKEDLGIEHAERFNKQLQIKIDHTNDIKTEVIKPWLEQLPYMSNLELSHVLPLPVMKEVLFEDLKKHICQEYGNPFDELKCFNSTLSELMSKEMKLHRIIMFNFVSKALDKAPVVFNEEFDDVPEVVKEAECVISNETKCYDELTDYIMKIMCTWRTYGYEEEAFNHYFLNFDSIIIETDGKNSYHFKGDEIHSADIYCGTFDEECNLDKKQFRREMDKVMKKLLEDVRDTEFIKNEIKELLDMQNNLNESIKKIETALKKHLKFKILPNDCECCS